MATILVLLSLFSILCSSGSVIAAVDTTNTNTLGKFFIPTTVTRQYPSAPGYGGGGFGGNGLGPGNGNGIGGVGFGIGIGGGGGNGGCPLCDSSVYSYCSHKMIHDSCCCDFMSVPHLKPSQCYYYDCALLYAKSCYEHSLIKNCCCNNPY